MGWEVCTCKVQEGDMQDPVMGYRSRAQRHPQWDDLNNYLACLSRCQSRVGALGVSLCGFLERKRCLKLMGRAVKADAFHIYFSIFEFYFFMSLKCVFIL